MARRPLNPDTALEIRLSGTARRLTTDGAPSLETIDVLQELAGGRSDLLAQAAGRALGGFLGEPGTAHPGDLLAAAYLAMAGADLQATVAHADQVRRAVEAPRYGTNP